MDHSGKKKKVQRKPVVRSGPLSFCQELLFLNGIRTPRFNPVIAEIVALSGRIEPTRICRALNVTIARHESLRSRYVMRKGVPRVEVLQEAPEANPVVLLDASRADHAEGGVKRAILAQIDSLDPGQGRVVASMLAKTDAESWLWMLAIHHLSSDGWSQHIYGRSFSAALNSGPATPGQKQGGGRDVSSIDYALRQTDWFESDAAEKQLEWWIGILGPLAVQPLPLRARAPDGEGPPVPIRLETRLESAIHAALHRIARQARVPMLAVVFAAFAGVVARRMGCPRVSVLSLVGGRTLPGADRATGAFYNSIVLTADVSSVADEAGLLRAAATSVFEGWRRQEVPLGLVSQACVSRGYADVVSKIPITFNLVRHPLADFRIPGCRMAEVDSDTLLPVAGAAKGIYVRRLQMVAFANPVTVIVCDLAEELRVSLDIDSHRFDPSEAANLLADYAEQLRWFAGHLGEVARPADSTGSGLIYAADGV